MEQEARDGAISLNTPESIEFGLEEAERGSISGDIAATKISDYAPAEPNYERHDSLSQMDGYCEREAMEEKGRTGVISMSKSRREANESGIVSTMDDNMTLKRAAIAISDNVHANDNAKWHDSLSQMDGYCEKEAMEEEGRSGVISMSKSRWKVKEFGGPLLWDYPQMMRPHTLESNCVPSGERRPPTLKNNYFPCERRDIWGNIVSKEVKKRDIVVRRCRPNCESELSFTLFGQGAIFISDMYDYVWCEGEGIQSSHALQTRWYHINFSASLGTVRWEDGESVQRYFAEVIEIGSIFVAPTRKVTSCVPLDENVNVSTENSPKCVICDCDKIRHPSSKFCIADDSSMNPCDLKEWNETRLIVNSFLGEDLV